MKQFNVAKLKIELYTEKGSISLKEFSKRKKSTG